MARGREAVPFRLPDVSDGHGRSLVGVAGHDNELVIIADEGPIVESPRPAAYRSFDRGRTWTGPVPIQQFGAVHVSGISWTGSTYVVTGYADLEGNMTPPAWRPAVWSGDGSSWTSALSLP